MEHMYREREVEEVSPVAKIVYGQRNSIRGDPCGMGMKNYKKRGARNKLCNQLRQKNQECMRIQESKNLMEGEAIAWIMCKRDWG